MRTKTTFLLAVAALVAGAANTARAGLVLFLNQDIPIPTTYAGVSVNLETGESTSALAGALAADLNLALGGAGVTNDAFESALAPSWQPVRVGTGNSDVMQTLGLGDEIGPTSIFSTGFGGSTDHFGPFVSGEKTYIGFSVVLDDGEDTLAYGWAEVTFQNDNTPGVLHGWAYDDSGDAVTITAIPEPSHGFLAALGLAMAVLRRRRS